MFIFLYLYLLRNNLSSFQGNGQLQPQFSISVAVATNGLHVLNGSVGGRMGPMGV